MPKSNLWRASFFPMCLVFYEIVVYLSNDMYLPALPEITLNLHTTHNLAQMTLTMWFLGAASMQLFLGPISDRFGRRPVLLLGGVLFVLSTLVCALAPNICILLGARLIQGSTVCSVVVAGYATIHELYDQKQAIITLAWMNSITVLAPALGPFFGSIVLSIGNWRVIFGLLMVLSLIILIFLFKLMPETCPASKRASLHLKILLLNYKSILSNADFSLHALAFGFLFSGFISWIAAGPFLVISEFKHSVFVYAICQIAIFGSFILAARLMKLLMKTTKPSLLIVIGLSIVLIAANTASVLTILFPQSLLSFIVVFMFYSLGAGLAFAPLQRLAVEACHEPMGAVMAIFSSNQSIFGVIGTILVGIFYHHNISSLALILTANSIFAILSFLPKRKSFKNQK